MLERFQRKRQSGEKKPYDAGSLFIGRRGGSFKKLPRYDRCEFFGGRVSTPTF
jgi:hypothetical protein